jgi:sn-glycerol 3-phosphate transport system substrate-binding protein
MLLSGAVQPVFELMKQQEIVINWGDFIRPVTGYYSKDGNLYSMPFNSADPLLPRPPATWKEVEAASRKILAAGAAKCGFTTSWPSWTMLENTFAWHNQPFATNDNGYKGLDTKLLINGDFGQMHIGALARWQKENIYS